MSVKPKLTEGGLENIDSRSCIHTYICCIYIYWKLNLKHVVNTFIVRYFCKLPFDCMHINIFDGNVITYMYIICIFSFGMQSFFLKMWQVNSAVYMAGNESNYRGGSRSLHFTCINVQYIHYNNKVEVKSESSGHFRTSSTQSRAHTLKSFIVLLHVLKASGSSWKTKSGDLLQKKNVVWH